MRPNEPCCTIASRVVQNDTVLKIDTIPNAHIKAINLKQEENILFGNDHYPRLLITVRFYFMRPLGFRHIKSLSKEHIHLCDGLQYYI
jgi:hypothetical protein